MLSLSEDALPPPLLSLPLLPWCWGLVPALPCVGKAAVENWQAYCRSDSKEDVSEMPKGFRLAR